MAGNYSVTLAGVSRLVFIYSYDNYGRMVHKTLPGNINIYIIYDPLFRPVLVQDPNLDANNQWNYIKYDVKGRAVSQGIYTDATHVGLGNMQTYVNSLASSYATAWYESKNGTAATGYYTNNIFPNTNITPLAYSFFDNYDLLNNGTSYYTYHTTGLPGEVGATTAKLRGMPTMLYKSTVGSGLATTWLMSVQFYDHDLHPIQAQTNNLLYTAGGAVAVTDYKTNVPDFVGAPLYSLASVKSSSSATTSVQTNITYDPMHRITAIAQGYNGAAVAKVAAYSYNELGQVIMKSLGYVNPTTWLQNVNFRYGIRGQLLYINNSKLANDGGVTSNDNNDLFGLQLLYDATDPGLNVTPYYDGRIAGVKWMTKDGSNNKSNERSYVYEYDGVARDKASVYGERLSTASATTAFNLNADGYDESAVTYDANGNILTLNRNASTEGGSSPTTIDILHYTYSSTLPNQLYTVTDNTGNIAGFGIQTGGSASGHYAYDANDNVTTDPYKALTITYNVLNKTDKINFTAISGQYINYIYDAGGMVMEKQQYTAGSLTATTIYKDGFVFINGSLSYFTMPEGRVLNNSGTLDQQFIITDQQGNARITFDNSGTGGTAKVLQENSYYPFGMVMAGSPVATPAVPNKNLYNGGSEWQNDYTNQPDVYQTFNRNYDPAIGRFMGVDPEPESAASMTNYQYAGNNPVMMNDPAGDNPKPYPLIPGRNSPNPLVFYMPTPGSGGGSNDFDSWGDDLGDPGDDDFGYATPVGGSVSGGDYSAGWFGDATNVLNDPGNLYGGEISGSGAVSSFNSAQDELNAGAHTLDATNAWGTNGIAASYSSAVFAYDSNSGRTGPALTVGDRSDTWTSGVLGDDDFTIHSYSTNGGGSQGNGNESLWSQIWNSPIVRYYIPDDIGIHFSATLVPTVGGRYSFNIDLLTRGKNAGFHLSQSLSGRVGEEAGFTIDYVQGWYLGSAQKATYKSLTGWGADADVELGPVNAGLWSSIDGNTFKPTWIGSSVGTGFGIGGSGGVDYTWPIK